MKKYLILLLPVTATLLIAFFIISSTGFLKVGTSGQPSKQAPANSVRDSQEISGDLQPQTITVNGEERTLFLPQGFEISVYSEGLAVPRSFTLDNAGNMFVAEKGEGRVMMIMKSGIKKIIDSNLRSVHGIDYYQGDLYVAEEQQVIAYRQIGSDGNFAKKEVLINDLPSGGNHTTRSLLIAPDNNIYVSVGSSCNVCEENDRRRAAITKYTLDGSGPQIYAEGLRNSVGLTVRPKNSSFEIWSVDNGRDKIGDDIPVEEVNIIKAGAHYGWPYCHGSGIPNPEYPDRENYCRYSTTFPTFEMQAHSAPLGLSFVPAGFAPSLDQEDLLITYHGSWNRTVPTGYKVVRLDTSDTQARPTDFITGFITPSGHVWGRPVEVKFQNRTLFISDDKAGTIYKVVYNNSND